MNTFAASAGVSVRDALIRQWRLIAGAIPSIDLDAQSRVAGWRNREVIAHLSMQPALLVRFLTTAGDDAPQLDLADNLSGTRKWVEAVVHGCDLVPPVQPDPVALDIAAGALTTLLGRRAPKLVAKVRTFDPLEWVDIATGRAKAPRTFAGVAPLMI